MLFLFVEYVSPAHRYGTTVCTVLYCTVQQEGVEFLKICFYNNGPGLLRLSMTTCYCTVCTFHISFGYAWTENFQILKVFACQPLSTCVNSFRRTDFCFVLWIYDKVFRYCTPEGYLGVSNLSQRECFRKPVSVTVCDRSYRQIRR